MTSLLNLIADTGATGHYFTAAFAPYLQDLLPDKSLVIRLPDRSTIRSSHSGYFHHPLLPLKARKAFLFPDLQSSLLSVSLLCDHGCVAYFNKYEFTIKRNNHNIISGHTHGNLWYCRLPSFNPTQAHTTIPPIPSAATSVALVHPHIAGTNAQRIRFYQSVFCHAPKSTLATALRAFPGHSFPSFTHLTSLLLNRYYMPTPETHYGRLDRTRKNYKSTRPPLKPPSLVDTSDSDTDDDKRPTKPITPSPPTNLAPPPQPVKLQQHAGPRQPT